MAEKLVQLKKKGGGAGTDKNLLFYWYGGGTTPVYYNSDLFTLSNNTLIPTKDIDITLWMCGHGYGNTSQYTQATLSYNDTSQQISVNSTQSQPPRTYQFDITLQANKPISFGVYPYVAFAAVLAYLQNT